MDPRATLVGQINATIKQAEDLQNEYKGKELPQEIANQISEYLDEVEGLQGRLAQHDRVSEAKNYMSQSQGVAATHFGFVPADDDEGDVEVDEQAWREIEIKTRFGEPLTVRFNVPLAVQNPIYKSAYEAYIRKGYGEMGPADRKALTEGTDSAGGFLVPEDMQMSIIKKVATMTVFRQYGRVVSTSRDRVKWPRIKYTTDDNYTSGVRLTWSGETPPSSLPHRVTDPIFGELDIPIHTAMASILLSFDLLEDGAFDVEGIVAGLFGEAFGLGEESAFWIGDGAGQPLGVTTNVDATDGVASVVSGSATTLTSAGLIDLWGALPTQYEINARFYWRKATEEVVRELTNATSGDYEWPVINQVGSLGRAEPTLLGFPVTRAEFVPAIAGNAFPILFGDLSGYVIADRVGMSIRRLDERYAETNQALLLGRKRVGGMVAEPWRMRVQKIST